MQENARLFCQLKRTIYTGLQIFHTKVLHLPSHILRPLAFMLKKHTAYYERKENQTAKEKNRFS